MDSANPSGGIAAFFAGLVARLTGRAIGRHDDEAPEPLSTTEPPEEIWNHGAPVDAPIPPAYLIAQMSEAEQAQYWKDWAIKTDKDAQAQAPKKS